MKRSSPCILFFVLSLFALSVFPFDVNAQQSAGIKISPVRLEAVVSPGETITQTILVTNDTDVARTMHLYVRDFKAEGEDGSPKLLEPGTEEGNYLSSWIVTDTNDFDFAPFEQKPVSFQVAVPPETGPGGYYGAVAIGNMPTPAEIESKDKGAAISVAQQTNSLLLFTVRGDILEEAIVKDFTTDRSSYSTPFDVKFLTRIENLGNVHVQPVGFISIFNMFGDKKGELNFNENGRNALPLSIRRFEENWQGEMGFGKYKAELILSYGLPPDAGGEGRKSLVSTAYFWIVPWKIITPIVGGFFLVTLLLIIGIRFYKNRAIKLAMEAYGLQEGVEVEQALIEPENAGSSAANTTMIILSLILVAIALVMAGFFIFFA